MPQRTPRQEAIVELRRSLRILEREVVGQLEEETDCCGVTLAQCHTLLELAGQDAGASLSCLAEALDLDTSTLSRTVESLVRVGLVDRAAAVADRRSVRLTLTPAGQAKVDTINATCNRYYADLLAGMSERDQQSVLRGVRLLAERMRSFRHEGPPKQSCQSKAEASHGRK